MDFLRNPIFLISKKPPFSQANNPLAFSLTLFPVFSKLILAKTVRENLNLIIY